MCSNLSFSKQNDLSRLSKARVRENLGGVAAAVGIELFCHMWSRARRAPQDSNWQQALRGDSVWQDIFKLVRKVWMQFYWLRHVLFWIALWCGSLDFY